MTNKEAEKELSRMKMDKSHTGAEYNAIMTAIKALKQGDALQDIRYEINQIKSTAIYSTIDLKDIILNIIDAKIKEVNNGY